MLDPLLIFFAFFVAICSSEVLIENAGFACRSRDSMRLDRLYHGAPQKTDPPFELTVAEMDGRKTNSYEMGRQYRIRLVGYVHFRGLLLQSRLCTSQGKTIGSLRGGEFTMEDTWPEYGIGFQDCHRFATNDSITHVNDDKKFLAEVIWSSQEDIGPVQFMLTIASENSLYWERWTPATGFLLPAGFGNNRATGGPPARKMPVIDIIESTTKVTSSSESSESLSGLPFDASAFETMEGAGLDGTQGLETIGKEAITVTPKEASPSTHTPSSEDAALSQLSLRMFKKFPAADGLAQDDLRFLNSHAHLSQRDFVSQQDLEEICRQSNPCENDAGCSVKDAKVVCHCRPGWAGDRCQFDDVCRNNSCAFGSSCSVDGRGGAYSCHCRKGFVGTYCQFECKPDQCLNNGECVMKSTGQVGCKCVPGTAGNRCEREINECNYNRCRNGASCIDRFNDYKCICKDGWMGKDCERPCQDVYGSCRVWKREGQCESMRESTDFFDSNCAASCGKCSFDNTTVITTNPLPPILLPLSWLLGEWQCHVKGFRNHTIDYPFDMEDTMGYNETVVFSVSPALMFGTPSINFTSLAVSDSSASNRHECRGFLSIRQYPPDGETALRASLMTVNNQGVTMIEEGDVMMTKTTMGNHLNLSPTYIKQYADDNTLPDKITRSFVRKGSRLMQLIAREVKGRIVKYTKTYTKTRNFDYL